MRSLSMSFAYIAFCALALGLAQNTLAQDAQKSPAASRSTPGCDCHLRPRLRALRRRSFLTVPGLCGLRRKMLRHRRPLRRSRAAHLPIRQHLRRRRPIRIKAQKPQRPVGTAAAEAPTVSGVTAAQPAGVAIAPAKQRRVRTLVLKVGAIVGAGVAVGTVIALTAATSSKPPGAH